jgi:hypothetical protein
MQRFQELFLFGHVRMLQTEDQPQHLVNAERPARDGRSVRYGRRHQPRELRYRAGLRLARYGGRKTHESGHQDALCGRPVCGRRELPDLHFMLLLPGAPPGSAN